MKPSFKTFALAAAFSAVFAFNSFAKDHYGPNKASFGTGIYATKSGKIHINVDKYVNENTTVVLSDETGNMMYREVVGKDVSKFRKTLNVNDLPAGNYRIDITSKSGKESKNFQVTDQKAEREISVK